MNILILTGSFGMGHNSAAKAIEEMIGSGFGDSKVFVEDLFSHAFNSTKYNLPFSLMVKRGKLLYNFVYRHTEDSDKNLKLPFQRQMTKRLAELIKETDADIIISTLWSCSKAVSDYKKTAKRDIPLITCITDISSHREWLHPYTDYYLAAAPTVKAELIEKGVAPERIIVSGIPVRSEFRRESPEHEIIPEKKLLIMGGGLGLLPKSKTFYEELEALQGVKTTIITGNNVALYNSLHGLYKNVEVLPFVNDVPRYMRNADLLISKPGGITLFETISANLPLLMFTPFLQQEIKNGEFVLENRLGDVLPEEPKEWTAKIRAVLSDDALVGTYRANMRSFKSLLDEDALLRLIMQYEKKSA
jgi:processive 1,2-diacylglycerol beta-glucosyltransferase